ncbi:extracellular solute-binding protein [Natronosporangium hydrolyticum]|uniref:Extracellular solute-binding protein n=1 Tax=Natronosporangium hydrolyticum TaxID=2811111 RepID=A0A895YFA8_9ACTN|nr:extracellular solute-binding protein [Natronosporangium hydrolyticum]QSB16497.1 extracellular solute-binding protein [Natronosporangium hydrolyticum]
MNYRRRTGAGLVSGAAALALVLAGCGDGDGGDSDSLTVWIMEPGNPEVQATIDGFGETFEEEHGVSVTIEYVPWPDAHTQLTTAIAGGQVPDVAELGNTMTPEFAEAGAFAEVESPDGAEYVDGLAASSVVDGVNYGYPWYAGARALIYRTDVFEEAGVDVPQSWDEVLEVGDTIADEVDDIAPIHVAGAYQHMNQPLVWGAGGEIAAQQGDEWVPGYDSPEGHEALEFFVELWERDWSPEGAVTWNSADVREAFANEQSAMMVGGGWDLRVILDDNPDLDGNVGVALMPAGPGGSRDVFAGGSHLAVFEESENQDLAKEFAEFMIETEQATEFADQIGFLPGTVEGVDAAVGGDPLFGVFGEQFVDHSRAYPVAGWWGSVEGTGAIPDEFQKLMLGDVTVPEAAANIDAALAGAIG